MKGFPFYKQARCDAMRHHLNHFVVLYRRKREDHDDKLLLGYYRVLGGSITIGQTDLQQYSHYGGTGCCGFGGVDIL